MRNRKLLRMMAGLTRTPQERRAERGVRRFRKLNAEAEQKMLLVDRIRQREQGEAGAKPMPFVREDNQ